jgi:hypothetical protein
VDAVRRFVGWAPAVSLPNGGNLFQAVSLALGELPGGLPTGAPTVPRMAPTGVRREDAGAY